MTREVANWFHDREGELFTVDEIPFDKEEIVSVIDDAVDPVQQIVSDGDRYIGVIDYEEYDGWYYYTRWDDIIGEVGVGVCAQCVKESDSVDGVSFTLHDDVEVADGKMADHYDQAHDVRPDEVETGATLLSGTTIDSNTAIHIGMDGSGSGVDADFIRGKVAAEQGTFYSYNQSGTGETLEQFSSPCNGAYGLEIENDTGCIWLTEGNQETSLYKFDKSGNQLQSSDLAGTPRGLSISESTGCLWVVDSDNNDISKLNKSGGNIQTISSPSANPWGVAVEESSQSLWTTNNFSSFYTIDQTGTVISTTSLSNGVSVNNIDQDKNGCVWISEGESSFWQYDQSGSFMNLVEAEAVGEFDRGYGLAFEESEYPIFWYTAQIGGSPDEVVKSNSLSTIELFE